MPPTQTGGGAAERPRPPDASSATKARIEVLSSRGSPAEAARRLFAKLHALDRAQLRCIHAELAPETGAGIAVNDRLRRAAAKRSAG